jgi:dihydrofolate reductase
MTEGGEDTMANVVVSQFVTVDGVFEDPGGSEKFERGGWAFQFDRGPEGNQFKLDEVMASEALLLGRTTYEGFAAAWPSRTGEFADKFNGMRKYVVSSTLTDPEWNNTTVISGNVAEEVAKLRQADGGEILVNGSAQLVETLMANDLVDEYRLMVFPVVLGRGKRLFGDPAQAKALQLAEARPVGPDGVVILTYRPAAADE